jgi:hypothetical protein
VVSISSGGRAMKFPDMFNTVKKKIGIKTEPPLTENEARLLSQLKTNRDVALRYIISKRAQKDFIDHVSAAYSNKQLMTITKEIFHGSLPALNYKELLKKFIYGIESGLKGSGLFMMAKNKVDTKEIAEIMLHGVYEIIDKH